MIEIKNLSKNYGSNDVLKNISAQFTKGNICGIIGENGAGKTTLFRCIAGLESYEGEVTADFTPLKNYLGFLAAEPYFFQKMTGKEYIQFLANARGCKLSDNDIRNKNIFDLPLNRYATEYSTGMKKKLAFTAILLQNNNYFILDEPFNGVDIEGNFIITEIIHTLKTLEKVIIISSPIFSTLSDTCDEIKVLNDGSFIKSIKKAEFVEFEKEIKKATIGNKIEKLRLG